MSISRRQLYAAGEPLGECATRREPGRIVCGGGDSESSQATSNTDKRIAVSQGIGISGDGNSVRLNSTTNNNTFSTNVSTDHGAVRGALDLATDVTSRALSANGDTTSRALDSVDTSNHLVADGFSKLIDASTEVFNRGQQQIGQTQQMVGDAWRSAQTDGKGTIDNKTIVVLAGAAAAVAGLAIYSRKR